MRRDFQRFLSDPDVPAIFQEGGLHGRPELAQLAREERSTAAAGLSD
jgi:hypothetical protein